MKVALEHDVGQKSQTMTKRDSEDFTSTVGFESASGKSELVAFFQENISDKLSEYNPRQLLLTYTIDENEELSAIKGFV